MKANKTAVIISKSFILLSGLSFLYVSILAFYDPQIVMNLVSVKLTNNDASSSIRGVYGGVGLTIFIVLIYKLKNNFLEALGLLMLLWGFYAASRTLTIITQGALGGFGNQWLCIETVFFLIAATLYCYQRKSSKLNAGR